MAVEKLSEGIRKFSADIEKLENLIKNKLENIKNKWLIRINNISLFLSFFRIKE